MQSSSKHLKPYLLVAVMMLFLSSFQVSSVETNSGADAATFSRAARQVSRPGCNCIPLRECLLLLDLLKNRHPQAASILRHAICSFQNKQPWVCCPRISTETSSVFPESPSTDIVVQLPIRCGKIRVFNKVVGGDSAFAGQFPWMALLGYSESGSEQNSFLCGGSVITDRYILTAAHCNDRSLLKGNVLKAVRLGEHEMSTNPDCVLQPNNKSDCNSPYEDFGVERFIPHPNYGRPVRISNDIALIRVDRKIDFGSYIQPVCLPSPDLHTEDLSSTLLTVAGWGATERNLSSNTLLFVQVPYVDLKSCNNTYRGILQDSQICAGGEPGRDSCRGDSGGPLIRQTTKGDSPFQQVALVSFGNGAGCGTPKVPGVYTSVLAFRSWIVSNLRP